MTTADYPIFANSTQYQAVAAGQTNAALGPGGGGTGDYLSHVTVVPGNTSPGAVSLADGGGAPIVIFAGGAGSLATLAPFTVKIGARSTSGKWQMTTGANVAVVACGQFT